MTTAPGETAEAVDIVQVCDVHKTYRRGEHVIEPLKGVDLTVREGELVALMGPSGSGKSTLLNILAGIDTATSGQVLVAGEDISDLDEDDLSEWRTRTIGYIFQLYNLLPVLTAYENVELPLLLLPLSKAERRKHTMAALDAVSLSDRKDHYPRQLSGGQEQRVAIARAIVTDPKIVLADEPTGDLDRESAESILDLICALNERFHKTFVMVTHDPKTADRATRVLHLDKGLLADGNTKADGKEEG